MLANICETAAEAIGADPVLARVGALYHDIGKLKRPLFFVENQTYFGIENPHTKLNPRLSKMVITAHPKDGIDLAKEYGLPPVVQNFIIQHHGDSIASYFYNQAKMEEGADKLTLADMNEESANMLALQTRQSLATNSLSLASQASQSILKLF